MKLSNDVDLLELRDQTFVREFDSAPVLESTNSRALELAKGDVETPLLVITPKQTAGRGRAGNSWWSSEGALTFSLLLDLPQLSPAEVSSLSLTTGLAVCRTVEKFAPAGDVALKWPNDVYLNEKKIAGILLERPIATEPRLVVGVGVNVNNSLRTAPSDLPTATALVDELGSELSLTRVLIELLQQFEQRLRDHVHQREALLDQWRAYCMLTGRQVTVDLLGEQVQGLCQGLDEDGALLIEDDQGTRRCLAGVVSHF